MAIRTLNLGLLDSPLDKLGDVCSLFQEAAKTSIPANRALVSIIVLVIRGQLTSYFW